MAEEQAGGTVSGRPPMGEGMSRVLAAIEVFWARHGYSPSLRDLVEPSGYKGPAPISYQLRKLRKMGYITFDDGVARSIVLVEEDEQ